MDAVKIIGSGAIVRRFVECFASDYPDITFAIHARGVAHDVPNAENVRVLSIDDFPIDDRPTLVCCSVNEEDILRKNGRDKIRGVVAGANIDLIRSLIERRIFAQGLYFVLTNPSEVVGQYISEHAGNPNIYYLGLSVDHVRYRNILAYQTECVASTDFQLAGNHWDRSFPVFSVGKSYSRQQLDSLYEQYNSEVQKEFGRFKPPVQSGADAINHLVKSFVNQTPVPLSGRDPISENFVGGRFCTRDQKFVPNVAKDPIGESLYHEILSRHQSLMAEMNA